MTISKSSVIGVIVAVLVGLAAGYALFNRNSPPPQPIVAGAISDTYVTPTSVSVQGDPSGGTFGYIQGDNKYQWANLTNSSGRDRFINSIEYGALNMGNSVSTSTTAVIGLTIATTSSVTSGLNGNTNYIANANVIATSSNFVFQSATSTPTGSVGSFATGVTRIWPTGTSLVVESPATSSGSFWIKINYLGQ